LDGLSDADIKSVLAEASKLRFRRHSVVINQAHPADRMYLLTQGRARFFVVTHDGRKIILHWIIPGEVFGLAAICRRPSAYLAGVEMTQDSTALMWTRAAIRSLATRHPQLFENVVSVSQDYLEWYVATHESLTLHNTGERLAILLIRLSQSIGEHVSGGIQLHVRNEELANAANTTVFTVSRWLKKWQRCSALSKGRNWIILRSKGLLLQNIDLQNIDSL
jgi:CRP/FNR family transcriptional regulator, nitrogen oxide reductase regulator